MACGAHPMPDYRPVAPIKFSGQRAAFLLDLRCHSAYKVSRASTMAGRRRASSSAASKHAAVAAAPGSYLRLKKAQVNYVTDDQHPEPQPGIELLIPTTWDFNGGIRMWRGKEGCFSAELRLDKACRYRGPQPRRQVASATTARACRSPS